MLAKIMEKSRALLTKKFLLILLTTVLFILFSVYVYKKYVIPRLNPEFVPNQEFIKDSEENKEAELMFFYVNWCPHCKKAMPIWESLKEKLNGKKINNTVVYFKTIDCEKNEDLQDKYKIEGYPTIKLVKDNEIIEYDAKPEEESLMQFLNSTL